MFSSNWMFYAVFKLKHIQCIFQKYIKKRRRNPCACYLNILSNNFSNKNKKKYEEKNLLIKRLIWNPFFGIIKFCLSEIFARKLYLYKQASKEIVREWSLILAALTILSLGNFGANLVCFMHMLQIPLPNMKRYSK